MLHRGFRLRSSAVLSGRSGDAAAAGAAALALSTLSFELATPRVTNTPQGPLRLSNTDSWILQEAAARRTLEPLAMAHRLAEQGDWAAARSRLLEFAAGWEAFIQEKAPEAGGPGRNILRSRGALALSETATALEEFGYREEAEQLRAQAHLLAARGVDAWLKGTNP